MRAVVQDEYGPSPEAVLRLADVPRPEAGDNDLLVRVCAASVDRGTWHAMAGLPYPIRLAGFGVRRPKGLNPGRNVAGIIESAGANVTGFAPGDEVYGTCDGAFAEYAIARAGRLASKPAHLSFEHAAAIPVSGLTALQAVRDKAQVRAGQTVLVTGASGGVGTFAVQIAKAVGAEVTGVCSTAKVDLVRSLGADRVLDYTRARRSPTAADATTRSWTSGATARCRSSAGRSRRRGGSSSSAARRTAACSAAATANSARSCCRAS